MWLDVNNIVKQACNPLVIICHNIADMKYCSVALLSIKIKVWVYLIAYQVVKIALRFWSERALTVMYSQITLETGVLCTRGCNSWLLKEVFWCVLMAGEDCMQSYYAHTKLLILDTIKALMMITTVWTSNLLIFCSRAKCRFKCNFFFISVIIVADTINASVYIAWFR